jgi:ABC-type Fe3+/spermidine/putrescine transport system ATPase subunit
MIALALDRLAKTHPGASRPVVKDLSLEVTTGSLTALLGPSGSGKTTVMKLIAGLIQPDAGDIRLGGRSLLGLPPERRGVVMVFQNPLLFPHLTLEENLAFGLRMRGRPATEIAAATRTMLARVQLDGLGQRRPAQLSGGQQQRAALARALVLRPDLLLLDEPLSNLDATLRDDMRDLIRDLQRETGITTILVTHDQAEAVVLADRIALLIDGRLAQHAAPQEFYRRPASAAVARFFGAVNLVPGRAQGGIFHAPLGPLILPPDHPPGLAEGPACLTLRPEGLRLGPGPNARAATVTAVTFLGTQSRVEFALGEVRLTGLFAPDLAAGLAPGGTVTLSLPPESLWLVAAD